MAKNNLHQNARKRAIEANHEKARVESLKVEAEETRQAIQKAAEAVDEAAIAFQQLEPEASHEARVEAEDRFNKAVDARELLQNKLESIEDELADSQGV